MRFIVRERIYCFPESAEEEQTLEQAKKELMLPNPEYLLAMKHRGYAGKISPHLHFYRDTALPRGYRSRLVTLFPGAEWRDETISLAPMGLNFSGSLREYQESSLRNMERHQEGLLCAPCGSGKTVTGLALIARRDQPALVLVHTKDLLFQWQEAVRAFLGLEPGIIGGGKRVVGPVTIGMVQTLQRGISEEEIRSFGLVLVDECHHVPARTFSEVVQSFPARYRYGLTATPEREDGLTQAMYFSIGPRRYEVKREELQDAGLSLKPRLFWQKTAFQYRYCGDYQKMITAMIRDQARNDIITDLANRARDAGRVVLVLSSRVNHCDLLGEQIPGSVVVHGELTMRARKEALEMVRDGSRSVLVASSIADEGLDIPSLDTLIVALPFRAKGKGVQRIGRIMRPMEGKREPFIVDIVDRYIDVLRRQAQERWERVYCGKVDGVQPSCI